MPENPYPTEYIRDRIKVRVSELVAAEYGIDWHPRIVRQRKSLQVGTLAYIDYAIPCHELAEKTKTSPREIAINIERLLKLDASQGFEAEAIEGFINFELSRQTLVKMQKQSSDWYVNPELLNSGFTDIRYLMVGLSVATKEDLGTTERTHAYLEQIYKSFRISTKSNHLVDDYSNIITEPLFELLRGATAEGQPSLYRSIRNFLSNPEMLDEDLDINKAHKELCSEWVVSRKEKGYAHDSLTFGSAIREDVHAFLDGYESGEAFEILKDEASKAVYYIGGGDTLSLRSANGMLYTPAFVLFMLHKEIHQSIGNEGKSALVVMGSHRLSLIISAYIQALVSGLRSSEAIMYFDPRVSKADVIELSTKAPNIKNLFKDANGCLQKIQADDFNDVFKRRAILNLIDFPLEISEFAGRLLLPQLFDGVSQVAESIELINS